MSILNNIKKMNQGGNSGLMSYLRGEKNELKIKDLVCLYDIEKIKQEEISQAINNESIITCERIPVIIDKIETGWYWIGHIESKYSHRGYLLYNLQEQRIFVNLCNLVLIGNIHIIH